MKFRPAHWYLLSGLLFLILSYLQLLLPENLVNYLTLLIFWTSANIGMVLLFDGMTLLLEGKSLLREIFRSKRNIFSFIIAGTMGGLLLDGIAQWLGKLWIYPYWNTKIYALVFIIGFSLYFLVIIESYLAVKSILKHLLHRTFHEERYYTHEPTLYALLGFSGILLVFLSLANIVKQYTLFGGYVFDIATNVGFSVNFREMILLFIGFWFLFEYIEYVEKKTSLLKDLLHHYGIPISALVIASILLALLMETLNATHNLWLYVNWPLDHLRVLSLPLVVFLVWPLHYVIFLSLFRVLTAKESREIWR